MNPYRELSTVKEPRWKTREAIIVDIIDEAWHVCKERQAAWIGKEPPRWRIFALSDWRLRRAKYAFMIPDTFDVLEARRRLGLPATGLELEAEVLGALGDREIAAALVTAALPPLWW